MTMVTIQKTKSGTKVFVVGGTRLERNKALDYFLKYFNRDFTVSEQKIIGNVWYDLKTGVSKNSKGKRIAETGTFIGPDVKKLNPGKKKMVDLYIGKDGRDSEYTIVHEMIHAKKFMQNIPGNKHNEKMIDFESVGRISREGLKYKNMHGYYFDSSGNQTLAKMHIPKKKKGSIAHQGVLDDRRLLTGSLNTSIIGKVAESRAVSLYPQSFFNKKRL